MNGRFIDYGSFAPIDFCWHYWESEWHLSVFHLEWGEQDRSMFSIGWRDGFWFDLFWMRVIPK